MDYSLEKIIGSSKVGLNFMFVNLFNPIFLSRSLPKQHQNSEFTIFLKCYFSNPFSNFDFYNHNDDLPFLLTIFFSSYRLHRVLFILNWCACATTIVTTTPTRRSPSSALAAATPAGTTTWCR